jgi:hypothetical protein
MPDVAWGFCALADHFSLCVSTLEFTFLVEKILTMPKKKSTGRKPKPSSVAQRYQLFVSDGGAGIVLVVGLLKRARVSTIQ